MSAAKSFPQRHAEKRKWSKGQKIVFGVVAFLTGGVAIAALAASRAIYAAVADNILLPARGKKDKITTANGMRDFFNEKIDNELNKSLEMENNSKADEARQNFLKIQNSPEKWEKFCRDLVEQERQRELEIDQNELLDFLGVSLKFALGPFLTDDENNKLSEIPGKDIFKNLDKIPSRVFKEGSLEFKEGMEGIEYTLMNEIIGIMNRSSEKTVKKCHYIQELTTYDGVKLDGFVIRNPKTMNEPHENQKWIVYCEGNLGQYELSLVDLQKMSQNTGANILLFNYRGVGRSGDLPRDYLGHNLIEEDLIADGDAAAQFLLKQGVQPKHIMMYGHSQGGAVATQVALLHQEPGNEMRLCVDRSFKSYKKAAVELAKGTIGKIGGFAAKIFAMRISNQWKFNTEAAFNQLKKEHKEHTLVLVSEQDAIVTGTARLGLKLLRKKGDNVIFLNRLQQQDIEPDTRGWLSRKIYPDHLGTEAHNVSIFHGSQAESIGEGPLSPRDQYIKTTKKMLNIR